MSKIDGSIERKIPMGQKIAFGFGMLANQMFPASLQIFMVILVQDLGFPPHLWGLLFFYPDFLTQLQTQLWVLFLIILNQFGEEEDNTSLLGH